MGKQKENSVNIIAMKGHPGSGKSTIARAIAATLKCPLIDKDHFRDCTLSIQKELSNQSPAAAKLLNDLSYDAMWRVASAQLGLGLSVVIDSPLSSRAHLDRLLEIAEENGGRVIVVECKPRDESEWRRRLELRSVVDGGGSAWHKPATWREMERLLEGYDGCWDYEMGHVEKIVLDTTGDNGLGEMASRVIQFIEEWD